MAANKVLSLILDLAVTGAKDAVALDKSINALKKNFSSLKFDAALFDTEPITKTQAAIERLGDSVRRSLGVTTAAGAKALEGALTSVGLSIADVGRKFDLDFSKGKSKVDLIINSVKNTADALNKLEVPKGLVEDAKANAAAFTKTEKAAEKLNEKLKALKQIAEAAAAAVTARITAVQAKLTELGAKKLAISVDASNLDKFEEKLKKLNAATSGVTNGLRATGNAAAASRPQVDGYASAVGKAATGHDSLVGSTLFLRRALIGLGFTALGREVLDTVVQFDRLRATFDAVFQKNGARELEFIKIEADRLGISVTNLGDQYAKFITATKGTTIEGAKARDVFLATAEAAARLSLSQEDLNGTLVALQQIASKGRLSLEELRQQLGDRLPGAVRIAAEALGLTQEKLFALIETGKIDSTTFLTTFGQALRSNFGTDQNTRIETISASIQRVKTAFAQLIDSATQGDGVRGIRDVTDALSKFFNDPATLTGLKSLISNLAIFTKFLIENTNVILSLAKAYIGFKLITGAAKGFEGLMNGITGISQAAGVSTTTVKGLGTALSGLSKIVGVGAILAATYVVANQVASAAVDFFANKAEKAAEKVSEFNANLKKLEAARAITTTLVALGVNLDLVENGFLKSAIAVRQLTGGALTEYAAQVQVAIKGNQDQIKLSKSIEASYEAQIFAIENNTEATQKQKDSVFFLKQELQDLKLTQERLVISGKELTVNYSEVEERVAKLGITLKSLDEIKFDGLTQAQRTLFNGFEGLQKAGKSTLTSLAGAIPDDLAQGAVESIENAIKALEALKNEGKITGEQLQNSIGDKLSALSGNELQKFQINAQAAFDTKKIGLKGLEDALNGALRAALAKFGVDAELAGSKISRSFKDALDVLRAVATNATATGAQLKEAIDSLVNSAKTIEEIEALKTALKDLEITGVKAGFSLQDAFERLEDKARSLRAVLDNALGDSFKRFGIQSKEQLGAVAEQAEVDFGRIKDSGLASLDELKIAFNQFAESAAKALGAKLSVAIKLEAFNLDAFDVLVKAAQTAADKVAIAFQDALNNATSKAQLNELEDAINNTFERGRIAVLDYVKAIEGLTEKYVEQAKTQGAGVKEQIKEYDALKDAIRSLYASGVISANLYARKLDEIATKTFELTQQAADGFAGAIARLGVQTRDQLGALAAQLKMDFQQLNDAGLLTAAQLKKAFTVYAEAAIAANNGIADSFLKGQAAALGMGDVLDSLVEKVVNLNDSLDGFLDRVKKAGAPQTFVYADMASEALLKLRDSFIELGRRFNNPGFFNSAEDILKELERRGALNTGGAFKAPTLKTSGSGFGTTAGGRSTSFGASGDTNTTFNFNSPNVTPAGVRDSVLPALDRLAKRTA